MHPELMLRLSGEELSRCNALDWEALLVHVIGTMTDWLGYEVELAPLETACIGEGGGFCLEILRASPTRTDLFWWKGILGASVIEETISIQLSMFPYSGAQRLVSSDGKDHSLYLYETDPSGVFKWRLLGWFRDGYGEFDKFMQATENPPQP